MGVVAEILVKENIDMMVHVIDKAERTDTARLEAKIFLHTPLGGKTEFPLAKEMLKVMNAHGMIALKNNQIMTIALMVAEEKVLAVSAR